MQMLGIHTGGLPWLPAIVCVVTGTGFILPLKQPKNKVKPEKASTIYKTGFQTSGNEQHKTVNPERKETNDVPKATE